MGDSEKHLELVHLIPLGFLLSSLPCLSLFLMKAGFNKRRKDFAAIEERRSGLHRGKEDCTERGGKYREGVIERKKKEIEISCIEKEDPEKKHQKED